MLGEGVSERAERSWGSAEAQVGGVSLREKMIGRNGRGFCGVSLRGRRG